MTPPKPAAGPPSPSGVRRGGDRFQDLFVWGAALQVVRPDSTYSQVEVEVKGVGNLDDVILRSAVGSGDIYGQVKWASNASEPLTEEYLLDRTMRNGQPVGRSVLQKLYDSYGKIRGNGHAPTLRLITNRALDGAHPLLGHVDGRTQLLVPHAALAGPNTDTGKAVDAWAQHVGASREELLAMLASLEFHPGRTIPAERDHVRALMVAAGLDDSDTALQHGFDIVAGWVVDGKRIVTAKDVNEAIDERGLRQVDPSAILLVQAIDTDPHADEATVALNWVDLFDGDQPRVRVQPRDPADWGRMDRELTEAAATLEAEGWTSTLVRGAMRQATFFRVGTALPAVRQHTLRYLQSGQLWSTDTPKTPVAAPQVQRTELNLGADLAVAVGVAVDPTDAVATYLGSQATPVGELLTIQPAAGADDQAVANAGQAVAYAQQIRDLVRQDLDRQPDVNRVHLFLAGPGGLALLLGHRWNRIRPTVVYEHLGPGRGYTPAFTVDA
jgi:SMODS-associated and fused to various effectors sensor domain